MLKAIIIGIVVTIVGLFTLTGISKRKESNTNTPSANVPNTAEVYSDANQVKVAISGEINHPGSYYIGVEDTLMDLIDKAGGVTEKADTKAYNPSILISTHTSFYIPPKSSPSSACVETEITKVNINTADKPALRSIGLSESRAQAVIDYRTSNGPFQAIEDIRNVSGIAEVTFRKIKNKITISD